MSNNTLKGGDPFIWITGSALAFSLLMVVGLILLIVINGMGFFWPKKIERFSLSDGRAVMGQVWERENIPGHEGEFRIKVKQGNRDLYGSDFLWINESDITKRETPENAALVERLEWGDLIGEIKEVLDGDRKLALGGPEGLKLLSGEVDKAATLSSRIYSLERKDVGALNLSQERIRLKLRGLELNGVKEGPEVGDLMAEIDAIQQSYSKLMDEVAALRAKQTTHVIFVAADGQEKDMPISQIVRVTAPNSLGFFGKIGYYVSKFRDFIFDNPRESNTEGGVFPAIFGTVMLVMIMSVMVTPLGVLAAFYLREYARQGTFVSIVRIAVNNLAGVPSIVFGVFGVGFFIYFLGGSIDKMFFSEALPTPTFGTGGILWASMTLALLTMPVVIVATEEGLASIPKGIREASLALGATKFETTWRVVLPAVAPSIMTGLILAMARAAGEVAPLMITGVVKLAPSLPIDGVWPFAHLERKFMHLGFHIYDVGFQSPNVDAARPMVYTTTLLLLVIVLLLNLGAITARNRLRKKFSTSAV